MINNNMGANFRDDVGRYFCVRCLDCNKENKLTYVAKGICYWCGKDYNKKEEEKTE